jgi:hypothetical protein
MASFLCGVGRRLRPWLAPALLNVSIAGLACIFLIPLSGCADETPVETPVLQNGSGARSPPVVIETETKAPTDQTGGETTAEAGEIRSEGRSLTGGSPELGPIASHGAPSAAPTPDPEMDEVNQYLWGVYERSDTKRDGSGDFTWKDVAAAARLGISLGDYVISGMDRDFRELLYRAGLAMDAAGLRWTILSGFRDDYRQGLASGYKAHIGDSLHGGSFTTGGYGHGCAVDIKEADGRSHPLWTWLDANSTRLGLERPLPGLDPAHVQPRGPWHEIAASLRRNRLSNGAASEEAEAAAEPTDLTALPPSEADMLCIGLHHHQRIEAARMPTGTPAEPPSFKAAARAHSFGKALKAAKLGSKPGSRLARTESPREAKSGGGAETLVSTSARPPHAKPAGRPRHALHPSPRATGAT